MFQESADFDPGPGEEIRTSNGAKDIFLTSFDANGDFRNVLTWGGGLRDMCWDVAFNGIDRVYVAGEFQDSVDFDTGLSVDERTSNGFSDAFVSCFNTDGDYIWCNTIGGVDDDRCYDVEADFTGTVVASGVFRGEVDLDPGPGQDIRTAPFAIFLDRFQPDGSFIWADTWETTEPYSNSFEYQQAPVALDATGNVFLAGSYDSAIDLDPGPGTNEQTGRGYQDVFLVKLSPSGEHVWGITWGGYSTDDARGVHVDGLGNIIVAGNVSPDPDLDPGPGFYSVWLGNSPNNMFISKFPPDGIW
jgi:hypothetical protein